MRFINLFGIYFLGLLLSITLISCGGKGNSSDVSEEDDSYNIDNISVIKVQPLSSVFKSGHEGTVAVTVKSVESDDAKDVPVSIIFMKNDETGEEQHYAGTYIIPVVTPGEDDYELKINIPSIDGEFGNYNILACLYEKLLDQYTKNGNPTDEEIEVNIDDNNDIITVGDVDLDPSLQTEPDLQIKESRILDDVFILKSDSLAPADPANLAVQLDLVSLAGDLTDGKVKFYISHLDGTQKYDIQVKDADGNPVDEIDLPDLVKYVDVTQGYDLVIPSTVITALKEYIKFGVSSRYPFVIGVTVTSEAEPDEFKSNNLALSNFWLVPDDSLLPVETPSRKIGFGLDRFFGNTYLGAGVKVYSYTGIDKDRVYSENGFIMPMKLLSLKFNFFEATLNLRGYFQGESTDGGDPGLSIYVKRISSGNNYGVPGFVTYSYYEPGNGEWKTEGIKDGSDILDALCNGTPSGNGTITLNPFEDGVGPKGDTDFSTSASYSYSTTVMAGPIPITFTLGITGYAGVGAFVVYDMDHTSIAAGLIPYCGLTASAEGGVGVPGFQAGAGAELDLIYVGLNNYVWTNWQPGDDSNNDPALVFSLNEYSGLELDLLSGRVYVFAEYPWPKFKKVMGCKVFVGFYTKRSEKNLWRTSGWCFTQHYPILPRKEYNIIIPLD